LVASCLICCDDCRVLGCRVHVVVHRHAVLVDVRRCGVRVDVHLPTVDRRVSSWPFPLFGPYELMVRSSEKNCLIWSSEKNCLMLLLGDLLVGIDVFCSTICDRMGLNSRRFCFLYCSDRPGADSVDAPGPGADVVDGSVVFLFLITRTCGLTADPLFVLLLSDWLMSSRSDWSVWIPSCRRIRGCHNFSIQSWRRIRFIIPCSFLLSFVELSLL